MFSPGQCLGEKCPIISVHVNLDDIAQFYDRITQYLSTNMQMLHSQIIYSLPVVELRRSYWCEKSKSQLSIWWHIQKTPLPRSAGTYQEYPVIMQYGARHSANTAPTGFFYLYKHNSLNNDIIHKTRMHEFNHACHNYKLHLVNDMPTHCTLDILFYKRTCVHTIPVNLSLPGQNCCNFADDIFKYIFINDPFSILIKISLKLVPKGPIDDEPALV